MSEHSIPKETPEEILDSLNRITPWPWYVNEELEKHEGHDDRPMLFIQQKNRGRVARLWTGRSSDKENAHFIARAPERLQWACEAVRAAENALDFAAGAIADAIYSDDGLDGDAGQKILQIIAEWKKHKTFDKHRIDLYEAHVILGLEAIGPEV